MIGVPTDGDGRIILEQNSNGETTFFMGNYYEQHLPQTSSAYKEYVYADGVRIALRINASNKFWFHNDHLGGTNVVTRESGNVSTVWQYDAWGVTRRTGEPVTDRLYTGQTLEAENLYNYGARWPQVPGAQREGFDPRIGRFLQADTILPVQQGTQAWDRFAYVNNNPINLIDPSGNIARDLLETDGGGASIRGVKNNLLEYYDWTTQGDWTLDEQLTLLHSGVFMEKQVSAINDGLGKEWMRHNTGGTVFDHGSRAQVHILGLLSSLRGGGQIVPGAVPIPQLQKHVFLSDVGINLSTIIHELGHVIDNVNGPSNRAAVWYGGGPADDLTIAMGGKPEGFRFSNIVNVDAVNLFGENERYGNTATAEYFAVAFTTTLTNPMNLPNEGVGEWIRDFIRRTTP